MATLNIHSIIEQTVSLRDQGHVMNPNHVRGILTQIEWSVGVNEPNRATSGLDAIIELVTNMRDQGREIDDANARGIMRQIEWVIGQNARIRPFPNIVREVQPHLRVDVVAIDSEKFESCCEDSCAICLDTHRCGDTIVTECGHSFCQQCWLSWMDKSIEKTCPTCRKSRPASTRFVVEK